ncbi:MAG: hypothetical protein HRU40_13600 [Saprospiraceae bacterium]|nr:hypothetical protein [Saprospiraceae bacterium]
MSFDVSGLTTYIDETKFDLLTQLQSTSGLAGVVRMVPGIKGSSNVHFLDTTVTFQDDACSYNSVDSTPLTEKNLAVGAIAIMEDVCVKTLNQTWLETQVRAGDVGEQDIPQIVAEAWTNRKLNAVANAIAIADFQGDTASGTANLNKYDGLLKLVDADGTVIDGNTGGVTVATGVTAANIISILQGMFLSRGEFLRGRDDVSLWIPEDWYELYIIALINTNNFNYTAEDGDTVLFGTNVVLRPSKGLTGLDRAIMTYNDNIIIGADMDMEEDDLRLWYSQDDRVNKSLITFKRGIQYGYGNAIVEFTLVP